MTREEAKNVFLNRGFIEVEGCRGRIFHPDKWREACVVISEWLKEESIRPKGEYIKKEDLFNSAITPDPYNTNHSFKCSVCDCVVIEKNKFCPNCVAAMRGSET